MKHRIEVRPHPKWSGSPSPMRWQLLIDGKDISDLVTHDGLSVDFDDGKPSVRLTLVHGVGLDLTLPEAEVTAVSA